MRVIKNRSVITDAWQIAAEDITLEQLSSDNLIVPLSFWLDNKEAIQQKTSQRGVSIAGDADLTLLANDLDQLAIIAIQFSAFRDGRGYSLARILRKDYGYQGELRAVGNVLRDQVAFMERVGFNSFEIDDKQDAADALNAFEEISVKYQTSADEAKSLFQRHTL